MSTDVRATYLDHDALTAHLHALAAQHPDLVRLRSIGTSGQGRPLWLLVVGKEPDRARPALWVDGNMHASELCGTQVALAFVDDLLAIHRGDARGLSSSAAAAAREALVYVLPRMSPDGAEHLLHTGGFVRSMPVDDRPPRGRPHWRLHDVDGDGRVRRMRKRDPHGDFVESSAVPGLLVPRTLDDDGPYYSLYPEGSIDEFDGRSVPSWHFLDDNRVDLNRNFAAAWAPEHEQEGAGAFPGSTPEAHAVMATTSSLPHLYAWLNLHTFGGVWIRPPGDAPDSKLSPGDRALFRLVDSWVDEHAHVPVVSGFEEFCYVPERPLRGDLQDWAWKARGCLVFAVELWDLFARAGHPRKKPFVDHYMHQNRAQMEALARYVVEHQPDAHKAWRAHVHPQLGDVEVGGLDPLIGVWNPPPALLREVCDTHSAVFLRMLSLLPQLHVTTTRTPIGADLVRIDVDVANRGGMDTRGVDVAHGLSFVDPLAVELVGRDVAKRVHGAPRVELGSLGGWCHGLYGGIGTWPYQASTGAPRQRRASFIVHGDDPVSLRVGSARTGFLDVDA